MPKTFLKDQKQEERIILDAEELVYLLLDLLKNKKYKKRQPYPKFNIQEARFIRDLIFRKPKGLLFFYLADNLMNTTSLRHLPMFNAPSMRKLRFFYNFLVAKSAKEAAIKAGYSPKTAKQQGHRVLREIQGYRRQR